jgi:hypothetical protein
MTQLFTHQIDRPFETLAFTTSRWSPPSYRSLWDGTDPRSGGPAGRTVPAASLAGRSTGGTS